MLILGIESSCDDTSVALMDCSKRGCFVVKELTASQIEVHKKYGGVVPEIAGRLHAEKIVPLIEEVLANTTPTPPRCGKDGMATNSDSGGRRGINKPDAIAVTSGPGLITGLIVGVEAARTLSYAWNIPLVGVNHIEGHIHSVEIKEQKSKNKEQQISNISDIQYPALALVVSGGHTELIYIKKQPARHASAGVAGGGQYKKIGATVDDAAGECFDKIAKLLDLSYPGGPKISELALTGKTDAIKFPRPMLEQKNYQFSFSGLKTSALYWLQKNNQFNKNDFCASFEQAIIDVLIGKTIHAAQQYQPKTIILAGGVAANKKLRADLAAKIKKDFPNTKFLLPETKYCMDNAAMIAIAGYYQTTNRNFINWKKIQADPNWELA